MSVRSRLSEIVGDAFASLGLDRALGEVVPASRAEFGHFQCNGAMAAARSAGRPPRQIAEEVATIIRSRPELAAVEIAGPGFINLTVADDFLGREVGALTADERLGVPATPHPEVVVVDYGGPNVAKPMHVGHLRATIIGDSIARIFDFVGHQVIRDPHFGDWGLQMGMLIVEMERRHPDLPYFDPDYTGPYPEEPPVTLDDLQEMYPEIAARCAADPEWAEKARRATVALQQGRPGYRALWEQMVKVSLESQRRDFADLGVTFDVWYSESTVHDRVERMIERLRAEGYVEESEGALIIRVDLPDDTRELPPLILAKSDGGYLYGTTDLATIEMRVQDMGATLILYVVDARQADHFEQVFRAARKTGIAPPEVGLEHIKFGTMNGPDGKPFKTREGGVVRLRELIDMVTRTAEKRLAEAEIARNYPEEERRRIARQVGLAALKFGDLINNRVSDYTFDLDRFTSFEGKTGPYLQYGAVRIQSILRNASDRGFRPGPIITPTVDAERQLMLWLTRLPDVVTRALELRAPNGIAEFAYDLTSVFNRFYESCHILGEADPARRASWLSLVRLTLDALARLLDLLGIELPERM